MNLTALIVTWNRLPQLQNTVKATLALPFQHIVIVNNGSTDGTKSWLDELGDSRIHKVHESENRGGAEGFYLGSKYISENIDTEWIVFYDDDAWPSADFIEQFKALNLSEPSVACTKVIDCDGKLCSMNLPWRKRTLSFKDNLEYIRHPENYTVEGDRPCEAITCSFVGSIVHAEILKKTYTQILRELFIYFDDVYYGYSLHLQGYSLRYYPSLIMYHDIGGRPKSTLPVWKSYYLVRNMFLSRAIFKEKSFFSVSAILFRTTKYFLIALKSPDKIKSVSILFRAIKDGITDNRDPFKQ